MEFGFACPECGSQLESLDNDMLVTAMDERVAELEDELNVDLERDA
jgi:transcription initiation factor TFIIE subunit alpha